MYKVQSMYVCMCRIIYVRKDLKEFLSASTISPDDTKVLLKWGEPFFGSFTKENAYDVLDNVKERIKDLRFQDTACVCLCFWIIRRPDEGFHRLQVSPF